MKVSKVKSPMNDNKIFRIMMIMVFVVSGVGMIVGGIVSLIDGDAEAFFALLFC